MTKQEVEGKKKRGGGENKNLRWFSDLSGELRHTASLTSHLFSSLIWKHLFCFLTACSFSFFFLLLFQRKEKYSETYLTSWHLLVLHTQCSLQLGEEEGTYTQNRRCWVNWRPAAGSQVEEVVHGAGEAAQQKQQTWGSASAYRQVTLAAEKGAGRRWGDT